MVWYYHHTSSFCSEFRLLLQWRSGIINSHLWWEKNIWLAVCFLIWTTISCWMRLVYFCNLIMIMGIMVLSKLIWLNKDLFNHNKNELNCMLLNLHVNCILCYESHSKNTGACNSLYIYFLIKSAKSISLSIFQINLFAILQKTFYTDY